MQTVGQGGTTPLDARFTDGTGALVTPTTPLVDILDPSDVVVVNNAVPTEIATGIYEYEFTAAVDAPLGVWKASWTGVINGVPVGPLVDTFEVVDPGSIGFEGPTDLSMFVESYRNEVGATEAQIPNGIALQHLKDAFWDAWWDGYFREYKIEGNSVVPIDGDVQLAEGMARLIVLYAGYRRIRTTFLDFKTRVAQSAGRNAVSNEIERSATLAVELLRQWAARLERLRADLDAVGAGSGVQVRFVNGVLARTATLAAGLDVWTR